MHHGLAALKGVLKRLFLNLATVNSAEQMKGVQYDPPYLQGAFAQQRYIWISDVNDGQITFCVFDGRAVDDLLTEALKKYLLEGGVLNPSAVQLTQDGAYICNHREQGVFFDEAPTSEILHDRLYKRAETWGLSKEIPTREMLLQAQQDSLLELRGQSGLSAG